MIDKNDLINVVFALEKQVLEIDKKENIINDLKEWFGDFDINQENYKQWFETYLEDLYSYLIDYSILDLKERVKGTKNYLKELKGGLK